MEDFLLIIDTDHSVFIPQTEKAKRWHPQLRIPTSNVQAQIAALEGFSFKIEDERG